MSSHLADLLASLTGATVTGAIVTTLLLAERERKAHPPTTDVDEPDREPPVIW